MQDRTDGPAAVAPAGWRASRPRGGLGDTQGRAYRRRKLDEGKRTKEALRALKRQIANAVYRHQRMLRRPAAIGRPHI